MLGELHPTEDIVNIGNDTLIGVEGFGSLTVAFLNKERGVTVKLERLAYVLILAFNYFSFLVGHNRELGSVTDDEDISVTFENGRLRLWSLMDRILKLE